MTADRPSAAVDARVAIVLLALARGADTSAVDQVLLELGEDVQGARAARLPASATPIAAALPAGHATRRLRA